MAVRRKTNDPLAVTDIGDARSDYVMAKRGGAQTKIRRGVPSQGAGADYHYRNESDWLWMQEVAWDIHRNHVAAGSIVKRAVENQIQDGFNYDPRTGDKSLDKDLKAWWADVSVDPEQCSPDGESVFVDQEETALLSTMVGGDCFALPYKDGTVDCRESQFCRTPTWGKNKNIFQGIEMAAGTRRRINYWMLDEPIAASQTIKLSQLNPVAAWYYDDLTEREERNCFHIRLGGRFRQTRGITAFAPIFNVADFLDDIEFLELVHKRAASLFAFVVNRAATFDPKYIAAEIKAGVETDRRTQDELDANARQYQEVAPGTVLRGLPGEQINMQSPNIPNPEHFQHVEMLLTYIGINLGMPLIGVLMDGRQTNFSGWRGAWNMALNGFRRNQRRLITRFHCPYLRFKLLKLAEEDSTIRGYVLKSRGAFPYFDPSRYGNDGAAEPMAPTGGRVNIFSHWWQPPSWPYIQPVEDATADLIRDTGRQTSPRRRCQERSMEWNELWPEIVEDWSNPILAAKQRAKEINDAFPGDDDKVSWRDIFQPPLPDRVNVAIQKDEPLQPQGQQQQTGQQPKNDNRQ